MHCACAQPCQGYRKQWPLFGIPQRTLSSLPGHETGQPPHSLRRLEQLKTCSILVGLAVRAPRRRRSRGCQRSGCTAARPSPEAARSARTQVHCRALRRLRPLTAPAVAAAAAPAKKHTVTINTEICTLIKQLRNMANGEHWELTNDAYQFILEECTLLLFHTTHVEQHAHAHTWATHNFDESRPIPCLTAV